VSKPDPDRCGTCGGATPCTYWLCYDIRSKRGLVPEVPATRPPETCKSCKHWRGPSTWNMPYRLPPGTKEYVVDPVTGEQKLIGHRPYGLCDKARDCQMPDGMNITAFHVLPSDGTADLETHEGFGCLEFEAKGES